MPSLDERREVAARLRSVEADAYSCCETYYDALRDAVGCGYGQDWQYMDFGERLADLIEPEPINGETSDGYHTFNDLYHHRALLFSVIVRNYPEMCWKSKKHHTGDMYEGMFIVGIDTPDGQASYHYDIEPYWDMFECEELEFAPEWDGHTPDQAIERIGKLTRHEPEPERTCRMEIDWDYDGDCPAYYRDYVCSECKEDFIYYKNSHVSYCPNCGSRVIE